MNESAMRMNRGMEFNNPFPNRDLEQLTKKMEELRERAGHFSLSVGERLANVREQLQTYSQIAQEKIIQTDHNLTMLAHLHREKIIDGAEFAAAHPVEATKIVAQKGWIYAAGAGARCALIATGTAMGYMLYPVAALGTAFSSVVVGGYKDWKIMQGENGAQELYNKYVGKNALREDTYDDEKTGWWNAVKKFTSKHSMSVAEGYRRAYGAYTYKEMINQMVEDTSDENFGKYAERIANATQGEIDYRALHSLQAELRDKLVDASYGVAVAMNNRDLKNGQAVIAKYLSVLQQTARYTNVDTVEFMDQVAEKKNEKLQRSAKVGYTATLLSRGSWSMARFASGGALLGRFTPKAEVHDAIFGNQHQPETPDVQIGHAVRDDQYVPKTETAPQPKPSFKTPSVRTDIRSELRAENAAYVHTAPEPKVAAVPRVEMKSVAINVEKNQGLFISLENSGWGETSQAGSGMRFMAEVAPRFRGQGLSEEQYQELMRAVHDNRDSSAIDLWKKFKWFDTSFMVHAGKFNVNIPQVVDDPTIKVNYDFTAQTVRRQGVPKVLYSVLLKDDPPPKPEGGVLHPGGSGLRTSHVEGAVLHPGGRPKIPVTENVPIRPLPDASDRLMDNPSNHTSVPNTKPNVLHPGGGQTTAPAQSEALRPGESTINQQTPAANTETLKPGSTVINTPTERMHPGSTTIKDQTASTTASETLRPGATTINDHVEQQAAAQPLPAAEAPREKLFNFNQEFFVSSANKIIEITKENVKRWLHLPMSINELPAEPNWDETIVSEYMGRTIIFVHSARKDGMDLPGNFFREAAELGQSAFGYGPDQVQEYLKQAVTENRTALFTGQDGSQQSYRLTNAFYQPYREVVQEDLWGNKYDNNLSDLAQYVSQTNEDDVIIVFCGRSHVEAIRKGIEIIQEVKSTLPAEQKDIAESVITTLQNSKAAGQEYTTAVKNMFTLLKENNPKEYEKLLLLYTGEPFSKDPEALKKANPYMFSGARYVLGLSPVK